MESHFYLNLISKISYTKMSIDVLKRRAYAFSKTQGLFGD